MKKLKVTQVKGKDIKVGQVFKPHGRWLRVVKFDQGFNERGFAYVICAPADKDPRLGQVYPGTSKYNKLSIISIARNYPTRDQDVPVWDWVTRKLEA